jgi:Sigma-70 region 2
MGLSWIYIVTDCDTAKAITEQLSRPRDNTGRPPPAKTAWRQPNRWNETDEFRDGWSARWRPAVSKAKPEHVKRGGGRWTEGRRGRWVRTKGLPGQGLPAPIPPPLLAGWEVNDGMLPLDEERELVGRVQASGDRAAQTRLLRQFFYLINREAKGKAFRGVPKADLQMAGVIALLAAIEKFDLGRGYRLSTFVRMRIHGAMLDERKQWEKQGRHGESRDERWLMANHYKYADRQLIGGGYSASYNETLILALMAAMARPNDGIKDYTRERAIKAIGDFEAGKAADVQYDTAAEGGHIDEDDERVPEKEMGDSPAWAAVSVGDTDVYRRLDDEEWEAYCRRRARAHHTDAEGMYACRIDGATGKAYTVWLLPWDAHEERRVTESGFRTHPAPLRQVDRIQYEADQRAAHGKYDVAARFKLRGKRKRNWVFAPATVIPLDVLLQLAAADAAERRNHGKIDEASAEGCVRLEPV